MSTLTFWLLVAIGAFVVSTALALIAGQFIRAGHGQPFDGIDLSSDHCADLRNLDAYRAVRTDEQRARQLHPSGQEHRWN